MILKLKKDIFLSKTDYAVKNAIGETICKIAVLNRGYYIYNKLGQQVAQITFDKNTASMSIVKKEPSFPGAYKVAMVGEDKFIFSYGETEKGDEAFFSAVKGGEAYNFTIWGKPSERSYDIFSDATLLANVVPDTHDANGFKIRTADNCNILYVLMIAFSLEKLRYDPQSKF